MKVKKISEAVDWSKAMEHNNDNIDRLARLRTQVNIDPVMEEVIDQTEKADENAKKVFTDLAKEADDITPKDPDTGKKITMKPYTEKLSLDENLFKESWITFDGSWKDQTVKKAFYEEDDISDIAEKLMNWYGECFEGWEAADIEDALYGLEGKRIPGSSCPIVFTMEESEDDELDWDSEDYDESLKEKKEDKKESKHLCEDYEGTEYSDMLFDMLDQDLVDSKKVAKDLVYICNELDIQDYMKRNNYKIDFEVEESLTEMKDPAGSEFGSIVGYIYEGDKIVKKDESFNSIDDAKKWVEKEVQDLSDKKDGSLKEDWRLDPGTTLRSKSGNEITIKEVIPYVSEYDGSVSLKISYDYVLTDGKFGSSVCNSIDLFNMLNESVNEELTEEVDDEEDEETVFDFVDERLFGDPSRRNASNYRLTNSFCKDVWVPLVGGKGRFRNVYFYPSGIEHLAGDDADENRRAPMTDSGIAINLKSEDEASLAKAVADELNFKFTLTPINNSKYKFLAKIMIPESIYEMPIEDYLESIGKSIKDYRKRSKRKSKEN